MMLGLYGGSFVVVRVLHCTALHSRLAFRAPESAVQQYGYALWTRLLELLVVDYRRIPATMLCYAMTRCRNSVAVGCVDYACMRTMILIKEVVKCSRVYLPVLQLRDVAQSCGTIVRGGGWRG